RNRAAKGSAAGRVPDLYPVMLRFRVVTAERGNEPRRVQHNRVCDRYLDRGVAVLLRGRSTRGRFPKSIDLQVSNGFDGQGCDRRSALGSWGGEQLNGRNSDPTIANALCSS